MTDLIKSRPSPGPASLRAEIVTESISSEARTVPIVFTSGAVVRRWRWADDGWGIEEYDERLSLAPGAMRTEFLDSGRAPFLDAHDSRSNDSVIGVIEAGSVKIDAKAGRGEALVRFDDTELAERRFRSVRSGILRNVSVGYNVHVFTETRAADLKKGIVRELMASDWEPLEVSQVPIGADRDAETLLAARAYVSQVQATATITQTQRGNMPNQTTETGAGAGQVVDLEAVRLEGAKLENTRQSEIRSAARLLRLEESDPSVVEALRSPAVTVAAAREALIRRAADRDDAIVTRTSRGAELGTEDSEKRGSAMVQGLLARAHPSRFPVDGPEVAHYAGRSLLQVAEDALQARGVNTRGMSRSQIAELALRRSEVSHARAGGMHSSSDFPLVLADVANKSIRMGYESAPRTFALWARRVSATDFKSIKRVQLSGGLALAQVPQGGEYTRGTTHESRESYAIKTYGKIVAITRQVLIDDDLDAFSRVPFIYGSAAADLESDTVYGILGNNAALADGVALFHASHANLGTAGVPSVTTLGEARKLLRRQTDLDDVRLLNLQARFMIFPAALETVIDQLMAQTTPAVHTNVTPEFIRSLIPVCEPRLDDFSATVFYLASDPSRVDTIEYAYLAGEEGVQIETRAGFEVDGVEVKARLDFGAAAIDHRGLVKMPG
jgi:Caudovirus prohead serine protease